MRRALCIALCVGLAGCGFGPGAVRGGSGVQLRVTRDFGRTTLTSASLANTPPRRLTVPVLRFEAFSACCSTYGRVDLLPRAVEGEWLGRGTTNVDFNAPMRAALAKIQDGRFGICEGTGKPITRPRLEAQPWARFSIEYARQKPAP